MDVFYGWGTKEKVIPTIEDIQDKVKKVNTGGDPKVAPFEYNDYFYPNIQVVDLETQETIRVKLKEKAYKEVN